MTNIISPPTFASDGRDTTSVSKSMRKPAKATATPLAHKSAQAKISSTLLLCLAELVRGLSSGKHMWVHVAVGATDRLMELFLNKTNHRRSNMPDARW